MQSVLLIPTLDLATAERCLKSFRPSLSTTGTIAIVIYNGKESDVLSDFSHKNEIIIGHTDSEKIADVFASAAGSSAELLFGNQEYCRCYGGASNLLLAVGCAMGAAVLTKVDDDCLEMESPQHSWLDSALQLLAETGGVAYGSYSESGPSYFDLLPRETAKSILKYCYSKREFSGRLVKTANPNLIKNGNLALSRAAANVSCYPILFEPLSKTRVRGEAYFWREKLIQEGIQFTYSRNLRLRHNPPSRCLYDWLRSIIVGFDLSYVDRTYCSSGNYPSFIERRQAIIKFRNWLNSAVLPENAGFAKSDLLSLLQEDMLINFTDRVLSDMSLRYTVWRKLMGKCDLANMLGAALPPLKKYM